MEYPYAYALLVERYEELCKKLNEDLSDVDLIEIMNCHEERKELGRVIRFCNLGE